MWAAAFSLGPARPADAKRAGTTGPPAGGLPVRHVRRRQPGRWAPDRHRRVPGDSTGSDRASAPTGPPAPSTVRIGRQSSRPITALAVVALMVAASALVGVVGGQALPLASGEHRFDPRDVLAPPITSTDTLTPLSQLKSQLTEDPPRALFTVRLASGPVEQVDRVRTAALDVLRRHHLDLGGHLPRGRQPPHRRPRADPRQTGDSAHRTQGAHRPVSPGHRLAVATGHGPGHAWPVRGRPRLGRGGQHRRRPPTDSATR